MAWPEMQAVTILEDDEMVAWDHVTRADVLRAIKGVRPTGAGAILLRARFRPYHDL